MAKRIAVHRVHEPDTAGIFATVDKSCFGVYSTPRNEHTTMNQ